MLDCHSLRRFPPWDVKSLRAAATSVGCTTPHLTSPHYTTPHWGASLQEVVRTVHMKLDLARLQRWVVDVLITDLAKFFDVIAQDVHPIVGAHVGLGEASHLATHTEGFLYALPLGPWQSDTLAQLLGTPPGTIQGVHAGTTAALPFLRFMDIAYRAYAV